MLSPGCMCSSGSTAWGHYAAADGFNAPHVLQPPPSSSSPFRQVYEEMLLFTNQETFISADDLRVNLWHLGTNDQSFNIVDIKPANMEDLTEVGARVQGTVDLAN